MAEATHAQRPDNELPEPRRPKRPQPPGTSVPLYDGGQAALLT